MIYLAGTRHIPNQGPIPYFGILDLSTKKVTTVSATITNYPTTLSGALIALTASNGMIFVGGQLITSVPSFSTNGGFFFSYNPTTGAFNNLSSLLPVASWTVQSLKRWDATVFLDVEGFSATSAGGGIYTLSSSGTSLVNRTSILPSGFLEDFFESTSETGGLIFVSGMNLITGLAQVVAIRVSR